MDRVADLIGELMGSSSMSQRERAARVKLIGLLFRIFRDSDTAAAEGYVAATAEIPLDKLAAAVASLLRSHRFAKVPLPADLWAAAREAAGMDREQYRAGHYLPPPREWPPAGKRHAIHAGELEVMPKRLLRLPAGSLVQLEPGES